MRTKCIYALVLAAAMSSLLALSASAVPFIVNGGTIRPINTDGMVEYRAAPDGYIGCYNDTGGDTKYSMLLDIGLKPTRQVMTILFQNTPEYDTWWVLRKVSIKVSSHEDEPGFDPTNASLYDTTVLSNGTVKPEALYWSIPDGIEAGLWRDAALATPVAKRYFLIEVTEAAQGPISNPDFGYFFLGDVSYAYGYPVTGGTIRPLNTDGMVEYRPAPDGYIGCYTDTGGDNRYSMLLDIGFTPTRQVTTLLFQNTPEYVTWRVMGNVNIKVSSHEGEPGFDPTNTSLYDMTVLSNGTVKRTATEDPWNVEGLEAGLWRNAALTTPVAKRFFLIEVTQCPDGPVTDPATSYFFLGDVSYAYGCPVTGGTVRPLNTDAMVETLPAPEGRLDCYNDPNGDDHYSMCLDIGGVPTRNVTTILFQNTPTMATKSIWKVNIKVSSQENDPDFDPTDDSEYDTTVLSDGTVKPTVPEYLAHAQAAEAGRWRNAVLTIPVAKRFFLIEVTEACDGPISDPATSYFFLGDVSYAYGSPVSGGAITPLNTDAMMNYRPAPYGYMGFYTDTAADNRYSMCLDTGDVPAAAVTAILFQNTTEYTTWRVIGKVNIKVSSFEDDPEFDPLNASLYDTTVLSNGTVMPTASVNPWNMAGLQAGIWRTATLTTPAAKRYFLIEVTECPDGPVTNEATSYFFLGDVNYAFGSPRATDFGKQWVRSHPFTMDAWSVRWGDFLLDAAQRATYMNVLNTTLVPLSTMEATGTRTTADDLNLINGANASGLPWHGQLSCVDLDKVSACVNAITTPTGSNSWYIIDEPNDLGVLPAVGQVADWLRARRPNSLVYITGMLSFLTDDSGVPALQSAVDAYVKPDILYAGTCYPFINNGYKLVDPAYYDMLMGARYYASLYNKPFFAWVQSYADGSQIHMPSESQMRMNAFGYLTAGCKGLSYFTYDSSEFGFSGLRNISGGITSQYTSLQNMKQELLNLGICLRYLNNTHLFFLPGPARGGVLSDGETAWTSQQGANVACTVDGTTKKVGSYSAKFQLASGATTGLLATKAVTSTNMSAHHVVDLWIKSSIPLAQNQLQLLLDNTANCASPTETRNFPEEANGIPANTWMRLTVSLGSPASNSAIISVGIKQNQDLGPCTLWLDEVGTQPSGLTNWNSSADPDTHITNITVNSPTDYCKDGMIGFFTDDSGQKYFMLTNLYQAQNSDKVAARTSFTITFTSGTQLYRLRRSDGVAEYVPLTNNQYTWTLDGGTGDLFKYDNAAFAGL